MKPTLTSEQSSALSRATNDYGKEYVLRNHADNITKWTAHLSALNDIDLLTLSAALINGWDVEKSPVDLLRDDYQRLVDLRYTDSNVDSWCRGVREALCATGQYVEGINA